MTRIQLIALWGLLAMALTANTGCMTTAYGAAMDKRSVETQLEDKTIATSIKTQLMEDVGLKKGGLDFSVYCYNGNVFLVGEVAGPEDREHVLASTRRVGGFRSIHTYMLLKSQGSSGSIGSGTVIATKLRAKFIGDTSLISSRIDTEVVRGHVVLLGVVAGEDEIANAVEHAKAVEGVRRVKSFLFTLKNPPPLEDSGGIQDNADPPAEGTTEPGVQPGAEPGTEPTSGPGVTEEPITPTSNPSGAQPPTQ
jgi:hyperosmotically inducible protein